MADLSLATAVVAIKTDMGGLKTGLDGAKRETERSVGVMGQAFNKLRSSVSGLGLAIAAIGVVGAATGFALLVKNALNAAEAIADMADKAGISAERLQELRFAFSQNAADVGTVDRALVKFNAVLGEFNATGAGAAQAGFKLIGIETAAAARALGNTEAAFDAVVERLSRIEDPARRAGAAARIFGEEAGPQLSVLIGQGSAKVEELSQRARDLGIVLREDAVRTAAQASAALRAMGEVISTQVTGALIALAPQVLGVAQAFADSLPVILQWADSVARAFGASSFFPEQRLEEVTRELDDLDAFIADSEARGASYAADQAREAQTELLREFGVLGDRINRINALRAQMEQTSEGSPFTPTKVGGKTAAAKETNDYERLIDAVRARQRLATDELRVASAQEDAQDKLRNKLEATRIARELEAAAVRDGLTVTAEMRAEIETTAGAYEAIRNEIDAVTEARQMEARAAEASKRAIEAVGNAITAGIQQADSFKDALKGVALQLANLAVQGLFGAGPLGGALGGIGSSIGGALLGGLIGGGGSNFGTQTVAIQGLAGRRAGGGPVMAGMPYLVNEGTPRSEVFVPSVNGAVLNVGQAQAALRSASGDGSTVINFTGDFRGSTLSPADVEARFRRFAASELLPAINQAQRRAT